jgi:hypothetical protein
MGALQYAGETLDKPGRSVRGVLAGKPSELLNLIPFSDTLGITEPSESISGRDLLEKAGVLSRNTPGLDWGDVGGFTAEVLTDPLSFLGTGPLTAAGRLAKAEGKLASSTASRIAAGQQGALGLFKHPFARETADSLIFGKSADKGLGKLSGQAATRVTDALYGTSVGRTLNRMFNPPVRGQTTEAGQRAASALHHDIESAGAEAIYKTKSLYDEATESLKSTGEGFMDRDESMLREILETPLVDYGTRRSRDIESMDMMRARYVAGADDPLLAHSKLGFPEIGPVTRGHSRFNRLVETADSLQTVNEQWRVRLEDAGLDSKILDDVIEHFPRFHRRVDAPTFLNRAMGIFKRRQDEVLAGRKEFLKGIYGGTTQVNEIVSKYAGWGVRGGRGERTATKASAAITRQQAKIADLESGVVPSNIIHADQEIRGFRDQSINPVYDKDGNLIGGENYNVLMGRGGVTPKASKIPVMNSAEENIKDALARDAFGKYDYASAAPGVKQKVNSMAAWLNKLDPEKYRDRPFFNQSPFADMAMRARGIARAVTESQMLTRLASEHFEDFGPQVLRQTKPAVHATEELLENRNRSGMVSVDELSEQRLDRVSSAPEHYETPEGIRYVSADKVLERAGFNTSIGTLDKETGEVLGRSKLYELLGPEIASNPESLKVKYIPEEIAGDIERFARTWNTPGELSPVFRAYDAALDAFRASSTQMWPAFHGRNLSSGLYYNLVSGAHSPLSQGGIARDVLDAVNIMSGKGIEIDDALYAVLGHRDWKRLVDEAYSQKVAFTKTQSTDSSLAAREIADELFGAPVSGTLTIGSAKRAVREAFDLPKRTGLMKYPMRAVDIASAVSGLGSRVGNNVEDVLRLSHFLARRRQGYSPASAALSVKKWHFDYTQAGFTEFERNVMKRLVPFYSFMRNNTPLVLDELAKNPGGAIAQSIRAAADARSEAEAVPPYVGEGIAAQIGPETDNVRRFLSGTGLPFEEPFERFAIPTGLGGLSRATSRTLQKIGAQLTPAIKAPIESATEESLFTGKDWADSHLSPTQSPLVNSLLYNSPAGRFATTGRKLLDERKGPGVKALNLFTSLQITDVPGLDESRNRDAMNLLREMSMYDPNFRRHTSTYVPKDKREGLPDESRRRMQLMQSLSR